MPCDSSQLWIEMGAVSVPFSRIRPPSVTIETKPSGPEDILSFSGLLGLIDRVAPGETRMCSRSRKEPSLCGISLSADNRRRSSQL